MLCDAGADLAKCSVNVILHRGEQATESVRLLLHQACKVAAIFARCLECILHHLERDATALHFLLQHRNAFASLLRDYLQWIEAGIDHLHQVATHEATRAAHLAEDVRHLLEALSVATSDVADHLERRKDLVAAEAELKQLLRSILQICQRHWRLCCKLLQVLDHLLATLGCLEHDAELYFGFFGRAREADSLECSSNAHRHAGQAADGCNCLFAPASHGLRSR